MVETAEGNCYDCYKTVKDGGDALCEGGACSLAVARFQSYVKEVQAGDITTRVATKVATHRDTNCTHRGHSHE